MFVCISKWRNIFVTIIILIKFRRIEKKNTRNSKKVFTETREYPLYCLKQNYYSYFLDSFITFIYHCYLDYHYSHFIFRYSLVIYFFLINCLFPFFQFYYFDLILIVIQIDLNTYARTYVHFNFELHFAPNGQTRERTYVLTVKQ